MLPWEPAQPMDLGQAVFAAFQLCLWQGEGVGGGSDGTDTRRSELLAARAATPAHAAHGSGGHRELAATLLPAGCRRSLAALAACQRLLDPLPLALRGRVPAAAQPDLPAAVGQVSEAMGFSSPSRSSLLPSNQPHLPTEAPTLGGGMTAPWDPDLFLLTEAFPCPFFSPLLFQLRLGGSKRIRIPKRRLRAQPRGSAWGERSYSPAKAQLGTVREQKPLTAPPSTPDPRIGLHRAAASQ